MMVASRPSSSSLTAQVQQPQIQPRNQRDWWKGWLSSRCKNFSQEDLNFMRSQVKIWTNDLLQITSQDELDSFDDLFEELWADDEYQQYW